MTASLAFTLASAGLGVVAGIWFCVGSVFTSSAKIAELAATYWDYHSGQVQAYVEQTSQYSVGAPLLVLAFLLQVLSALVPPDTTLPLPGFLATPIAMLVAVSALSWLLSYAAYRALVHVKGQRVHAILGKELERNEP